ncbi:autophagy protein 5-like isoform X3 [Malus sylvestris]|uniref:autophagy protein 5 isoform X3 n=1 Tax=Malus domestica TaxID=3750 RepID=UPI0010AA880E|nr:autophagy protein 5 isoform X3 [Malus domestica]XP_050129146.1 autophagy protein 5-like isoform X3 [Malus sylvestris]
MDMEAQRFVWGGAIPLQIHLHESDVATLPAPPPALILAPRIGYLPLLASLLKPHFSSALPPRLDTIWFEYKGLPLKWYIPTGVLFDLLCAEPERPWNLTVHFTGYPGNILIPCDGEDSVKWSFINSLKEAAYIINGNCKNVMNMSQPDQVELWRSVLNGNLEAYFRVSSKLKLGTVGEDWAAKNSCSPKSRPNMGETDVSGQVKAGRCFTLNDAIKSLLPEYFPDKSMIPEESPTVGEEDEQKVSSEDAIKSDIGAEEEVEKSIERTKSCNQYDDAEIKLVRIQGIEPKLEIPFFWVANNLLNPEHFLHICVYLKVPQINNM